MILGAFVSRIRVGYSSSGQSTPSYISLSSLSSGKVVNFKSINLKSHRLYQTLYLFLGGQTPILMTTSTSAETDVSVLDGILS